MKGEPQVRQVLAEREADAVPRAGGVRGAPGPSSGAYRLPIGDQG